ncbi:MAG: Thioredoxin-like protein [Fibrobacteres bacterium]|nr:Thioredoxin-like protein [Fibrobacterota bacterium]
MEDSRTASAPGNPRVTLGALASALAAFAFSLPTTACAIAAASAPATASATSASAAKPASSPATPSAPAAPAGALRSLPAFTLPDLEGKAHDSKEWAGKVVVLDFWATWCTGCRETIPVLMRLQDKFGTKGLVVAGVSLDKGPKEKVAKFTRKMKMGYRILWDADDTLSKVFGFEGLPSVYVFGRDGALLKAMPQYTAAQEKEMEALVEGQFQGG